MTRYSLRLMAIYTGVLLAQGGCTARLEGPATGVEAGVGGASSTPPVDGSVGPRATLAASDLAKASIRRLSSVELQRTVQQVLFPAGSSDFSLPEARRRGFSNQANDLVVTEELVFSLQPEAERVAEAATRSLESLLPCAAGANTGGDEACLSEFLSTIGRQAWRRPFTAEEREDLLTLVYRPARDAGDSFPTRLATVVEAILQSPSFLYRTELGANGGTSAPMPLTPFETASALSYFILQSPPDSELMELAAAGRLSEPAVLEAQAMRLLALPEGKRSLIDFVGQWLRLADGPELAQLAGSSAELAATMLGDFNGLVNDVIGANKGAYDLLTLREGVLTRPAFIASHGAGNAAPIFLGKQVQANLLCNELPPPPPGVGQVTIDPGVSTRERLSQHRKDPTCNGCHALMDPIGFGFETLDELGRPRTEETFGAARFPLTGNGELVGSDVDGAFNGAAELGRRLATSKQVEKCAAAQLLTFALGRNVQLSKHRNLADEQGLAELVHEQQVSLTVWAARVVASDTFRFRDPTALPIVRGNRP